MSRRGGAVHVATTKRDYKGKTYTSYLLRRSFRENGKVKHETLGNISHLPGNVIDLIRRSLQGESFTSTQEFECIRSLPIGHVAAVLGTLRKLGLESILASRRSRERDLVVALIVARILEPRSKLATARGLNPETATSGLGEVLGLGETTEDDLYEAMDWLAPKQPGIEAKLAARHLGENTLVLYDVTSTYFEGRQCPLAKRGYSRDGKKDKLQIVIGLMCNRDGCPVAVEVFDGNTADPTTVSSQIAKLRTRFGLERVVLVGDRGMLTSARIREELKPVEGLSWISALRSPAIRKLVEQDAVDRSLFDDRDLAEIQSPDFPGERLLVCRNPLLAAERARKRQALLEATEKLLGEIQNAVRREKRKLTGASQIGLRAGRVVNRYKVAKHFLLHITDEDFSYERKTSRIEAEAALDGIYVVRTNVPKETLDAPRVVAAYKGLSVVERAFRSSKTVDLKLRPIHHHLASRVRTHVFLCMLAYYVEWHMRRALAPILFDDEEPEIAQAQRDSIVAPAQRSPSALNKAASKETEQGTPVHSYQTLLADLSTIVKNRMRPANDPDHTFEVVTTPTSHQRRAFELLDVAPSL